MEPAKRMKREEDDNDALTLAKNGARRRRAFDLVLLCYSPVLIIIDILQVEVH